MRNKDDSLFQNNAHQGDAVLQTFLSHFAGNHFKSQRESQVSIKLELPNKMLRYLFTKIALSNLKKTLMIFAEIKSYLVFNVRFVRMCDR